MVDNKNTSEKGRLGGLAKQKKYPQEGNKNPNWKNGRSKNNSYYRRRQKQKFPERIKANDLVCRSVKNGTLFKPNTCSICEIHFEDKIKIHGHHEDYAQPLKVVWCCRKCHQELHG